MAMLADIARGSGGGAVPPPVPVAPMGYGGGGGGGYGGGAQAPQASMYDAYAVAAATGEPMADPFSGPASPGYRRVRAAVPGGAGPAPDAISIEDALPFSTAAQRKQEEDEKMRELSRMSKQEAVALAKNR